MGGQLRCTQAPVQQQAFGHFCHSSDLLHSRYQNMNARRESISAILERFVDIDRKSAKHAVVNAELRKKQLSY